VDFNHIFVSTNSGITWVQTGAPFAGWSSIASSADGRELIAATSFMPGNTIYTSTDAGATWVSNSIPGQFTYFVTCSADGNELIAASRVGVYTALNTPTPQMNITPTNGNLALSWLVPSTNFVLQRSTDLSGWTDLTNQPALNLTNLHDEVSLPFSGSGGFYRLKTP